MKKLVIMLVVAAIIPKTGNAQDDMYFSPKDVKSEVLVKKTPMVAEQNFPTCHRDVDEYNRRGFYSYYQVMGNDSTDDAIDFYGNTPDTLYNSKKDNCKMHRFADDCDDDEYVYSRRLRYFDDFWWYNDPWTWGYMPAYGPYSAWYGYGWRHWYNGYYYGWYEPWYYGYSSWYNPWYYDYGYFHRPHYGGGFIAHNNPNRGGVTGTSNHGWVGRGRADGRVRSSFRGSNSVGSRNTDAYNRMNNARFSDSRKYESVGNMRENTYINRSRDINTSTRNNTFDYRGSMNRGSNNSGGSFNGGGHHGGGFSTGGATRSGGGGHFGGRR